MIAWDFIRHSQRDFYLHAMLCSLLSIIIYSRHISYQQCKYYTKFWSNFQNKKQYHNKNNVIAVLGLLERNYHIFMLATIYYIIQKSFVIYLHILMLHVAMILLIIVDLRLRHLFRDKYRNRNYPHAHNQSIENSKFKWYYDRAKFMQQNYHTKR